MMKSQLKSRIIIFKQHQIAALNLLNSPVFLILFLMLVNFVLSLTANASGGKVEALQMPAWIQRDGSLSALKPGMVLQSGDMIRSGNNARILIRMDEGSLVKLGENAQLVFDSIIPSEEEQVFFEAVLRVVKGAFRFTTTSLGNNRRRQINVRIGSITAGIRGTDIWGSATSDEDILCLIEGEITAQRAGEPEFVMRNSLSFYSVPKNKPALPVSSVAEARLAQWANETELQAASGILNINGQWAVNLMSVTRESSAKPVLATLTAAGYAAEIEATVINNQNWYRLKVRGFKSRDDALTFAKSIDGKKGINNPWVVKF
jgi:hypothetical protein